jgi:Zn-dependent peptidase ImmA (M78 family)
VGLVDYLTIMGRAAWVRHEAKLVGTKPPYSTRHIMETVFPKIAVTGTELPEHITEMAVADKGRRALYYNRHARVSHGQQRVGLMHGLYHHLSDMKTGDGLRECNLVSRKLSRVEAVDNGELACDLFAAEVLAPLDVLAEYAPDQLYPRDPAVRAAVADEIDHLASRFNVPRGFMRWRIYDLHWFRRTHYNSRA